MQGRLSQPDPVDVSDQIILCHVGHPRHCRKSSSISDFSPVKASSTPSPKLQKPKMFPDVATCLLGSKTALEVRTTGPQVLLTTDVPSSRGTATGPAPRAACRSDSAGDREGTAGLRAAPAHGCPYSHSTGASQSKGCSLENRGRGRENWVPYFGLGSESWRDSGHCPPAASAQPHTLENAAISRPPPLPRCWVRGSTASCTQSQGKAGAADGGTKRNRGNQPRVQNSTLLPFPLSPESHAVQY